MDEPATKPMSPLLRDYHRLANSFFPMPQLFQQPELQNLTYGVETRTIIFIP